MKKYVIGADSIQTSVSGENILPDTPKGWSMEKYPFYEFQFMNMSDCNISVNGGEFFFLPERFGIMLGNSDYDSNIESFVIQESGVEYVWVGKYGH